MIIGIDLGTTNSLVGLWTAEGPQLVPNSLGDPLTPSVVGVDDEGKILVGRSAKERLLTHPDKTVATFKRHMGSDRVTRLGKNEFRPEELSALVIRSLIADVQAHTGVLPNEAVISVPAYFSDAQRKATRNAGELAGIHVERLINEPTAAALAYGLNKRRNESSFMVLDLGGGTFDVSILEVFENVMEVHASAGDNFLGGEDFVEFLAADFLKEHQLKRESLSRQEVAYLRNAFEQAKCRLSGSENVETRLTLGGKSYEWRMDAAKFEQLAAPLLARMRAPIERALRDARIAPASLEEIVIVGGASRMPMVARLVTRMFGRLPLRNINPDEAIARGAAVMAGLKARDATLQEVVMTDVCPYTLGVEVSDGTPEQRQTGIFSPIIERNTVVPTSRESRYFPIQDHQSHIDLRIFQGESPRVINNVYLGELRVALPNAPISECAVDVRFTYDVNGLLEVEAKVVTTAKLFKVVIEQNPGLLSPEEIATRLARLQELKIHPREDQANLAVISRAERLYEEYTGELRQRLGAALLTFRAELEKQDLERIKYMREQFAGFLDQLEAQSLV
jgi:molecular chaperone HscC